MSRLNMFRIKDSLNMNAHEMQNLPGHPTFWILIGVHWHVYFLTSLDKNVDVYELLLGTTFVIKNSCKLLLVMAFVIKIIVSSFQARAL